MKAKIHFSLNKLTKNSIKYKSFLKFFTSFTKKTQLLNTKFTSSMLGSDKKQHESKKTNYFNYANVEKASKNSVESNKVSPSNLNPVADILDHETREVKKLNLLNTDKIAEVLKMIINTYDNFNVDLVNSQSLKIHEINSYKLDEYLIAISDKGVLPIKLLPSLIKAGAVVHSSSNIYCSTIIKMVENDLSANSKVTGLSYTELLDCFYLLKNTLVRQEVFKYLFTAYIPVIKNNQEDFMKAIHEGDYSTIIKYLLVFSPTIQSSDKENVELLEKRLINSYSKELEEDGYNNLKQVLENIYYSLKGGVNFKTLIEHYIKKITNDFSILNASAQVSFLGVFSFYYYSNTRANLNSNNNTNNNNNINSESFKQSIKKLFNTAQEEILLNGFESYRFNEIISISDSFATLNFGSAELFLEMEKYLAKNIDKLSPSGYLPLLNSLIETSKFREKFLVLLQKKISEKHEAIELPALCEIVLLYSKAIKESVFLHENLQGYFEANLNKIDAHYKVILYKAYSIKSNIPKKFIIKSDLEQFFKNSPPEDFFDKVDVLDSLVYSESSDYELVDKITKSILNHNINDSNEVEVDHISLLTIYSSIAAMTNNNKYANYDLYLKDLSKFDILLCKKLIHFNSDSLRKLQTCLTVLGYKETHFVYNLTEKTKLIQDKYEKDERESEAFEEKAKMISSSLLSFLSNVNANEKNTKL